MLSLIGIGLGDCRSIPLRGLTIVHAADAVYLDVYTSKLTEEGIVALEQLYHKAVIRATREVLEHGLDALLDASKEKKIVVVIPGSPFAATTHITLFLEAKKRGIPVEVIDNASVFTSIGMTGLQLYKFGKVATIPFDNEHIVTPMIVLKENRLINAHTLFLLDIDGERLMTAREGLDYLLQQGLAPETLVVACGALGSATQRIAVGTAAEVREIPLTVFPQCIIVPGPLHFTEEEALTLWKKPTR